MRAPLLIAAAVIAFPVTAAAQNSPSPATYPMPPPEPPVITTPSGHDVPARLDTFSDRTTRCLHYATSIGVPADQIADYTKRCALR
jgi:hypothetical protein